eukprot:TRINITY_DN4540_c0_g1_i2.p1 TRINITY_DN4540_c0_g1~~TRINITY_DN4540_c0_g1_i2.p1  ORF type:complete len:671 (-),score=132.07 TRINITY_DN4540_c0_g1_i2:55-2010(-)
MPDVCPKCNESQFTSTGSGVCCAACGYVVQDSIIVYEQTFSEGPGGRMSADGHYVSASGHVRGQGMSRPSREVTLENAKRRIQQLAGTMNLSNTLVDTAYRQYQLALTQDFVRGRRAEHVTAACLYVACRLEKTAHMLLDFADALSTNVYVLGHTFVNLVTIQHLTTQLPLVDPSLYIERFARQLKFGDKMQEVANTAHRLVQKMSRNWIVTGRRPSGICGAALLIAARVHGFERSVKEVVSIVRITDMTIRKRLTEFDATSASQLTPEEFEIIDLEHETNPPCFTRHREKEKEQHRVQQREQKRKAAAELERSAAQRKKARHTPRSISSRRIKGKERTTEPAGEEHESQETQSTNAIDDEDLTSELAEVEQLLRHRDFVAIDAEINGDSLTSDASSAPRHESQLTQETDGTPLDAQAEEAEQAEQEEEEEPYDSYEHDEAEAEAAYQAGLALAFSKLSGLASRDVDLAVNWADIEADETVAARGRARADAAAYTEQEEVEVPSSYETGYMGPSLAADQLKDPYWREGELFYWELLEEDDGNLEEFRDEDIDKYIHNAEEAKVKQSIWEAANQDYLAELEVKKRQQQLQKEQGTQKVRKKRGPRKQTGEAATAGMAVANALERRTTSSRINYQALSSLLEGQFEEEESEVF